MNGINFNLYKCGMILLSNLRFVDFVLFSLISMSNGVVKTSVLVVTITSSDEIASGSEELEDVGVEQEIEFFNKHEDGLEHEEKW